MWLCKELTGLAKVSKNMKGITEDYVSFETAKLLKERGFPQQEYINTFPYYMQNGHLYFGDINTVRQRYCAYAIAITQALALKWLREVYKWSIQVFPVFDNLKWCYDIYELKIQKYHDRPELLSDVDYDTYEEASEAGIKYCLENLI